MSISPQTSSTMSHHLRQTSVWGQLTFCKHKHNYFHCCAEIYCWYKAFLVSTCLMVRTILDNKIFHPVLCICTEPKIREHLYFSRNLVLNFRRNGSRFLEQRSRFGHNATLVSKSPVTPHSGQSNGTYFEFVYEKDDGCLKGGCFKILKNSNFTNLLIARNNIYLKGFRDTSKMGCYNSVMLF